MVDMNIPDDLSELDRTDPVIFELGGDTDAERLNEMMLNAVACLDTGLDIVARKVAQGTTKENVRSMIVFMDFGPAEFKVDIAVDHLTGEMLRWTVEVDFERHYRPKG